MTATTRIRIEPHSGASVMHVGGHLGIEALHDLKEACDRCLASPAVTEVLLDLEDVESGDATAVALLLVLRERGHALQKRISLSRMPARPVAGLDPERVPYLINLPPSTDAARGP